MWRGVSLYFFKTNKAKAENNNSKKKNIPHHLVCFTSLWSAAEVTCFPGNLPPASRLDVMLAQDAATVGIIVLFLLSYDVWGPVALLTSMQSSSDIFRHTDSNMNHLDNWIQRWASAPRLLRLRDVFGFQPVTSVNELRTNWCHDMIFNGLITARRTP